MFVEHLGKFILGVFGLVGVLVAVAGYAHSVGKDTGAAELSIYKTAEQLDLKKLSEAALATTADLKKGVSYLQRPPCNQRGIPHREGKA
ncbi:hypothetical protein Q1M64_18460 [Sinorhizobium meliloti]|nr:hypothetical protein Q1M64_18460 [Sinorhizobium meliloti]